MARSAVKKGFVTYHSHDEDADPFTILDEVQTFLDGYRNSENGLSSFILGFPESRSESFEDFERFFWRLLRGLRRADTEEPDPRVSSDPSSTRYSYSIHGEAFFVILCHPKSPRISRRTPFPVIVFNPHQQFEDLRARRVFNRVRTIIRNRDKILQGTINPMLDDFGRSSEIFQYTGKVYNDGPDEFMKEFYDDYSSENRNWVSPEEGIAAESDRP
jgi:FPC/CPF motif-containing protein YcgG